MHKNNKNNKIKKLKSQTCIIWIYVHGIQGNSRVKSAGFFNDEKYIIHLKFFDG